MMHVWGSCVGVGVANEGEWRPTNDLPELQLQRLGFCISSANNCKWKHAVCDASCTNGVHSDV
jgi:hypothetical protein